MNKMRVPVLAAAVTVLSAPAAAQSTLHVNGSCGDNTWSGLSPECAAPDGPKRTIQAAITAAANDDTILVADGIYIGTGNRNLFFSGKRLVLRSQNGPANCVIDAQGMGRAFSFADLHTPLTAVDGFTIRNGSGSPGGAFWFHHQSNVTVRNCIITNNTTASFGGGAYTETNAEPTFLNCTFIGNTAMNGGGFAITQDSRPKVINCVFIGNTATADGGALYIQTSLATIVNPSISGNTAAARGGGIRLYTGNATLHNAILWNNSAPEGAQLAVGNPGTAPGSLTVGHSIVQGGQAGVLLQGPGVLNWLSGNRDQDPRFVNPAGANLRLLPGSPAIDAADNNALPTSVLQDRDGNPRFVDDPASPDVGLPGGAGGDIVADIGAYEFPHCYANCDVSSIVPVLNVNDFTCFLNRFAASDPYANCDGSSTPPVLNVNDFTCFVNRFAAGCQ